MMHTHVSASPFHICLAAVELVRRQWKDVSIACISFAMLIALSSAFALRAVDRLESELSETFNMGRSQMEEEIVRQFQGFSSLSVGQLMGLLEDERIRTASSVPDPSHLGIVYILRLTPLIFLQIAVNLSIVFVAFVFFLHLFSKPSQSAFDIARVVPLGIFRMSGLLLWGLVRSYAWIPFVGPFLAIYFTPRLILAPVYLASGEAGVFKSLQRSMHCSSGKWLSIVLALVTAAFLSVFLFLWPMFVITGAVSIFSAKIGFLLWVCGVVTLIAWNSAFLTVLAAGLRSGSQ